jgi:hypothetical protein
MSQTADIQAAWKRLRGSWKSDRARTMAEWRFPKRLSSKKRQQFASIFGKNIWHFGSRVCKTQFEDRRTAEPYKILWASEHSVVVLFSNNRETSCHHLFFDGNHFYLAAGRAGNVEYFKRMPSNHAFKNGRAGKRRAA